MFWHHIFQETEEDFWHVWEVLAVGGYFIACFTEWILMGCYGPGVFNSPDKPLFFPPVFMSDPQQPTGEALSAVRAESLSVWSTSNIFEQFRQGWVQVIQSLPKKCSGEDEKNRMGFSRLSHFEAATYIPKLPINMNLNP